MLDRRWVDGVELGDYEAGIVVDVTSDGAGWDTTVGDAQQLEIWAWKDDWLDLLFRWLAWSDRGLRWDAYAFSVWDVAQCEVPDETPSIWGEAVVVQDDVAGLCHDCSLE